MITKNFDQISDHLFQFSVLIKFVVFHSWILIRLNVKIVLKIWNLRQINHL